VALWFSAIQGLSVCKNEELHYNIRYDFISSLLSEMILYMRINTVSIWPDPPQL